MDLAFKSLTEQAALIQRRELSPVELVGEYLLRIERLDDRLNCFVAVFQNDAQEEARALEAELAVGQYRGPLHGIPFAIKDVFALEGRVATGGLRHPVWPAAREDATVVRRLKAAGAILLGTLNTHELQLGGTIDFPFGIPRNPYDMSRMTGGSSSGSGSAVAGGLCSFSLGADTGGSVRVPASYCGIVGLKPTWSRISRNGVMRALWSLDCVGILARNVEDSALVFKTVAGYDSLDASSSPRSLPPFRSMDNPIRLDNVRVGVVRQYFDSTVVSSDVLEAAVRAVAGLEQAGALVSEVSIPGLDGVHSVHHSLVDSEVASANVGLLSEGGLSVDRNTRIRLLAGAALPAQVHGLAERARVSLAKEVWSVLRTVDVLVGPSTPTTAPPIDSNVAQRGLMNPAAEFNRPYSFAGVPAISVPIGVDNAGLPIGFQMASGPFRENDLFEITSSFAAYSEPTGFARIPAFKETNGPAD